MLRMTIPAVMAGNMGEARPACHIADGKSQRTSPVGRSCEVGRSVVMPSVAAGGDAGLIEAPRTPVASSFRRPDVRSQPEGGSPQHVPPSASVTVTVRKAEPLLPPDFRDANALDQPHAFHLQP